MLTKQTMRRETRGTNGGKVLAPSFSVVPPTPSFFIYEFLSDIILYEYTHPYFFLLLFSFFPFFNLLLSFLYLKFYYYVFFSCSGMFRDVPECCGMFRVPYFIDGRRRAVVSAISLIACT